jgi:hypothetical protein
LPLLWLLTLAQAHARSATVFVDELDVGTFESPPHNFQR